MARRLPLVAALAGLAVIAAVLGIVLAQERVPVTGGNNELQGSPQFGIAPEQEACQPDVVPPDTGIVRLRAGGSGQPSRLALEVRAGERVVAGGQARWDGAARDVDFPLDRTVPRETLAEVCVRNVGSTGVALWSFSRENGSALIGDRAVGYRLRTQYLGPAPVSRLADAGATVRRMATARGSLLDGWAPWGALAAALGLVAVVVVAAKRGLAP